MAPSWKITTCLWFDHQADEAARYSVSIFRNARVCEPEMMRHPDPAKAARAMRAMLGMKKFDVAKLRAAYLGSDAGRYSASCGCAAW